MERKIKFKRILGIVLVALSLGAISFWELWGRENLTYDSIAVLRSSVPENTIITESMIKERKVEKANEGSVLYSEKEKIAGLSSTQFIPKGAELYPEFFEESRLTVSEEKDNFILNIPVNWLESYPLTICRGDQAVFYAGDEVLLEATVVHVRDGQNQEVSFDDERLTSSAVVSVIEVIVDSAQASLILGYINEDEDNLLSIVYR